VSPSRSEPATNSPIPASTIVPIGPLASMACDACPGVRSAAALGCVAARAGITAPSTRPCVPSRHHTPTKYSAAPAVAAARPPAPSRASAGSPRESSSTAANRSRCVEAVPGLV
jgi:hypothetical protein